MVKAMVIDTGYVVYNPSNPSDKYFFDKTVGSSGSRDVNISNMENRLELKTFGRFPYVYYPGKTDYLVFELSTVFIPDEYSGKTARKQIDEFKALIKKRIPLMVENGQGQQIKCDVQIVGEKSPQLYTLEDFEYIELTIKCTQIDN